MNSINVVSSFIEKLKTLDYLVVLVGNGASMEGTTKSNEPYPDFSKLIFDVIESSDCNANKNITVDNVMKDYFNVFVDYIKKEQASPSKYLKEFFNGNTSVTHNHFISLLNALYSNKKNNIFKLIFITTNYDTFIEQSFKKIGIKAFSASLPENKDELTSKFFDKISEKIDNNIPVILHIFGDLKKESPIFYQKDMVFHKLEHEFLSEIFKQNMMTIGYSFSDDNIKDLVCKQNEDTHNSLYYISSKDCDNKKESTNPRIIYNANLRFNAFIIKILEKLYEKISQESESKSKRLIEIQTKYESKIKVLNYKSSYDKKFLEWRIKLINKNSSNKMLETISTKSTKNISELYVERDILNWNHLFKSGDNINVIVGDAGVGKSTYLFMSSDSDKLTTDESINKCHKLFITSDNLTNGLVNYLESEFLCQPNKLKEMFYHFDILLEKENEYFIILIDAINELGEKKGKNLKIEIENLFKEKWKHIKIVYTCRQYYWKTFLNNDDKILHGYTNYCELKYFNDNELEQALIKYKNYFNLTGNFENISPSFKEKLKDPLMLRLLAEGYENREIPLFAPAVKIFQGYIDKLNIPSLDIKDILIDIGDIYWNCKKSDIKGSMSISKRLFKKIDKNVMQHLKDSNIIYEDKDNFIQFTYERLFEFILGLSLIEKNRWKNDPNGLDALKIFKIWEKTIKKNKPYTFIFGLKSAIIEYCITNENDLNKNLITNSKLLDELLNIENITKVNKTKSNHFKDFILEVLRELLTELESTENGYEKLKESIGDVKFYKIILEIGSDDFRTVPYQIELLTQNNANTRQQIIFNLLSLCDSKEKFERLTKEIINNYKHYSNNALDGLIYLIPVFISQYKVIKDSLNISPLEHIQKIIIEIKDNIRNPHEKINFIKNISDSFLKVFEYEGPSFFGKGSNYDGIQYSWEMGKKEKDMAEDLANLFSNREITSLSERERKSIQFFASEVKNYKDINTKYKHLHKIKRIRSWEYFMAKYILEKLAIYNFDMAVDLLNDLMKNRIWLTFDFVLTTMENILRNVYLNKDEEYNKGLNKMKEWVDRAKKDEPDFFYHRLSQPNALELLFNPLSQTANTMVEKHPQLSFHYLDEHIKNGNLKDAKLAILSLRKVSRKFPKAGKISLELAWNQRDNYDDQYRDWLDLFIKELSFIIPKTINDLLDSIQATAKIRNRIKKIQASPKTNEYNINIFYKWLVSDNISCHIVMEFYKKMLRADKDIIFKEKIASLLR